MPRTTRRSVTRGWTNTWRSWPRSCPSGGHECCRDPADPQRSAAATTFDGGENSRRAFRGHAENGGERRSDPRIARARTEGVVSLLRQHLQSALATSPRRIRANPATNALPAPLQRFLGGRRGERNHSRKIGRAPSATSWVWSAIGRPTSRIPALFTTLAVKDAAKARQIVETLTTGTGETGGLDGLREGRRAIFFPAASESDVADRADGRSLLESVGGGIGPRFRRTRVHAGRVRSIQN